MAEKEKIIQKDVKAVKKVNESESKYTVQELAACSMDLFNTRSECVIAALRSNMKQEVTLNEAKKIIKDFLEKEVK